MKKNFEISDFHFTKARDKIITRLETLILKKKVYGYQKRNIESFLDSITDKTLTVNPFDDKVFYKLEQEKNKVKNTVSDYLWTEFRLQIEGNEQVKENFRANIIRGFKNKNKQLATSLPNPILTIKFANKQEENPGVQVIDFICNLVYKNGLKTPLRASNSVKSIYSKIKIEEIKNEI